MFEDMMIIGLSYKCNVYLLFVLDKEYYVLLYIVYFIVYYNIYE